MGNKMENSLIKSITLNLRKNNLCSYCILRFLNEKNPDCYTNADDYVNKLLENDTNDFPKEKKIKANPCSACLGLLQFADSDEYIKPIISSLSQSGSDSDNVTFALSLPITFLLRNRSVWLYITQEFLEFYIGKYCTNELKQECTMVTVKEVWKWISAQKIAEKISKVANSGINGNFHVNINVEYEDDTEETACLFKMFPKEFEYRSNHRRKFHGELLTRKKVESMLMEANFDLFEKNYPVPPTIPKSCVKFSSIDCLQDSIFIAGRYNKLSRNLSQTPWVINGEKRMETSVKEIIEKPISEIIPNSGIKFAGSGREDVDVRTLGKGRPFVVDISNPKRTKLDKNILRVIEKKINSSSDDVFVRDLQVVQKEELGHIKTGEESKSKTYTCYCLAKIDDSNDIMDLEEKLKNLSALKEFVIEQKTPIRVLHRRPLAVRQKTIYWLKTEVHEIKDNNLFFKLSLKVSAGTYIKEFVHGDFGRTSPNLSKILGRETDILALDVEEVALNWPPSLEYSDHE